MIGETWKKPAKHTIMIKVKETHVGANKKVQELKTISYDIGPTKAFLETKLVPLLNRSFKKQFETEGEFFGGGKWKPLAPATVDDRNRLKKKKGLRFVVGFSGKHPILQRTGKLKRSFYRSPNHHKIVVVSNGIGIVEVGSLLTVKSGEYLAEILTVDRQIVTDTVPVLVQAQAEMDFEVYAQKHLKKLKK